MIRVGITGQNGFIGQHFINTLRYRETQFEIVDFSRDFFQNELQFDSFVNECDVIVHLAAINRNDNLEVLHNTNIELTQKLVDSLVRTNSQAHVIFSSSTQENSDNLYGKSKFYSRQKLEDWSKLYGGKFSGLIIPNVFGPFCSPFYNSYIATFSELLIKNEKPFVDKDNLVDLIYVGDLIDIFIDVILNKKYINSLQILSVTKIKVSETLKILEYFKNEYLDKGNIPCLKDDFELKLFNTFRSYINLKTFFPKKFKVNSDARGVFVEIARVGISGQTSYSTTLPSVERGNHFHTRKVERFAVVKGKALIQIRKIGTEETFDFLIEEDNPAYIDIPIWYTHNIKNIGSDILFTIFWINEPYNPQDSDTYLENVLI